RVVSDPKARRERLDGTRAEKDRPGAIDPQVVAGDEPGVPGEEAVRLPGDPPVRLANPETIVAARRDRRVSDMDREGHRAIDPLVAAKVARPLMACQPRAATSVSICLSCSPRICRMSSSYLRTTPSVSSTSSGLSSRAPSASRAAAQS